VYVLNLKKVKKIQLILLYGNLPNLTKFIGNHHGGREELAGILNALQ